jgi:hypothetical protein
MRIGGQLQSVAVGNPSAGANFSTTVPAGVVWRLVSLTVQMVTSAVVANRGMRLAVQDAGGNVLIRTAPNFLVPASSTVIYTAGAGMPAGNLHPTGTQIVAMPLPQEVYMLPNYLIASSVNAQDVGDQLSAIVLAVEAWVV